MSQRGKEYILPGGVPVLGRWHRSNHGRAPCSAMYHIYFWRNLVAVTTMWWYSRNSNWFSHSKEGLECHRRAAERQVSCEKDWKEKGKGLVPGGLCWAYYHFLGKEDSGWCGFIICIDMFFAGDINLSFFFSFLFPLFLLPTQGSVEPPTLVGS